MNLTLYQSKNDLKRKLVQMYERFSFIYVTCMSRKCVSRYLSRAGRVLIVHDFIPFGGLF